MGKYNYFYNNRPISKSQFLQSVPENWEGEVELGEYSWGYYNAIEIEQN